MSRAPLLTILAFVALAAPAGAATTIVPDTFDDQLPASCSAGHPAGTCSLREAVAEAQDGDTIQLAEGTYVLQLDQLLVSNDVAFIGAGPAETTIEQHATGKRILEFDVGTTASMTGVTLTGGNFFGGDGANATTIIAAQSGGGAYGGAIYARGTALTLTLVDVIGNKTTGGKGGNGLSPGAGAGGIGKDGGFADSSAIDTSGHLTLDRVTVADNVAQGGVGGTGGNGTGGNDGGAGGKGGSGSGAVSGGSPTVILIRDSTISGNKGFAGDGGDGGNGGPAAGGDGADGGRSVRGTGGGVFSNGDVSIVNSTISGNEVHGGNGGDGGDGPLATGGDGGYAEPGEGGGISVFNNATVGIHGHIASSTITNNGAFNGSGGAAGHGAVSGAAGSTSPADGGNLDLYGDTLEIRDSVIAGGVAAAAAYTNCSIGSSTLTSHGYNVEDKNQCIPTPAAGDRHGLNPMLGPLQDNGGPTETMAPLAGSPLINGGPATCQGLGTPLTSDQRGAARDAVCDNGAYEAVAPGAGAPPSVSGSPVTGNTVTCTPATFTGDMPQTVGTVWLRDGAQVATGGAYAIPAADAGHALACRQAASNAYGSASAVSAAVQVTAAAPSPPPAAAVVLSKLRVKRGKVTFTLSAPARVTFKLCKGKGKACKRIKKHGPKALSGKKGTNHARLKLNGLKPGRYRLTATPTGGKSKSATFRIKR